MRKKPSTICVNLAPIWTVTFFLSLIAGSFATTNITAVATNSSIIDVQAKVIFDPIGKTEKEIIQNFGQPLSKIEMDTLTYDYSSQTIVFSEGKVIEFTPKRAISPKAVDGTNEKFDPIGKTEGEIIEKFGAPLARTEFGDDLTLEYYTNTVVFAEGKVTEYTFKAPAKASTFQKKPSSQANSDQADRAVYLSKLNDELSETRKEYSKQREEADKEIRDINLVSNWSDQSLTTTTRYQDAVKFIEQKHNISRLQERIKEIEAELLLRAN